MNSNQTKLEQVREAVVEYKKWQELGYSHSHMPNSKCIVLAIEALEALEEKLEKEKNEPISISDIEFNEPLWFLRKGGNLKYPSVAIPDSIDFTKNKITFTDGEYLIVTEGRGYDLFKYKPEVTDEVVL